MEETNSIISTTDTSSTAPASGGNPLAPAEGYEYDFARGDLPMRTPFDGLLGLPGIDNLGDIFAGAAPTTPAENNNPFTDGFEPMSDRNPFTEEDDVPTEAGGFQTLPSGNGGDLGCNSSGMETDFGVGGKSRIRTKNLVFSIAS